MNIFQQLMEKPWLDEPGGVVDLRAGQTFALPRGKLGLRVFLVVVMVMFSLFIAAYAERMLVSDWQTPPLPWLLWPNTLILILSSVAFEWAWASARRGRIEGVRKGLLASGLLALAFLFGQLLAWRELAGAGYYASTNPANAFFYLLTALHGLHLAGGLAAWGGTMTRIRRGHDLRRISLAIELCAVYWHFLLLIWLLLFTLLLLT